MMKVTAQIRSAKGFFGDEIKFEVNMVSEVSEKLVELLDEIPSEVEGVQLIDWTTILIDIERA